MLNQGAGAAGASTTRFYLSTNVSLDASRRRARWQPRVCRRWRRGAASGGTTQVTIPAGTAPGTYYFFVKADGEGVVVESQEGNNISWRVIQVTAGQP